MTQEDLSSITYEPSRRELLIEQAIALSVQIVITLGVIFIIIGVTGRPPSWLEFSLLLIFYVISILGITVGFHRYFTHRSFVAKPALRVFLAFAGSIALQGSILRWVADHRRHHQFSDKLGDPHSPHVPFGDEHAHPREDLRDLFKGLWWAHIGWMYDRNKTLVHRYAPDLLKDKLVVFFSRYYLIWFALSFLLPALIGFLVTLDWRAAISCLLVAGFLRIFLTYHSIWAVNSLGHSFGSQAFQTSDESTNIGLLAIPTFGDSYHNNHHAFPTSARHGIDKGQLDLGWLFIRLMMLLGLASNPVIIPDDLLEKRRKQP